jgi:hypothetical protein
MRMSKQHFDFIAEKVGPLVGWPSDLHEIADQLQETNPKFNREKFITRATKAWEIANADRFEIKPIDDEIPY